MPNQDMNNWMHTLGVAKEKLALSAKIAGAAAAGVLPQPMATDCKIVHGKVRGPDNHVLCGKHGHVLDIKAHTVIALDLADYAKRYPPAQKRAAGAGGKAPANARVLDMENMEIRVDGGTPMALEPQTAKQKAEVAKRDKAAAAVEKADADRLNQRLHSPGEVDAIVTRAGRNCDHYQLIIGGAADAFARYADKKVKEFKQFEKAVAPIHLFATVLEFALGEIAGRIGSKVGQGISEVGSKLADNIYKKVYGDMQKELVAVAVAKVKGNNDDSVAGLEQAVRDIAYVAKVAAAKISKNVGETINTRLTAIADGLKKSGNPLSDEDAALLTDFMTGNLDEALEHFGVPSEATAKVAQIAVLKAMVKDFEQKRIVAWHDALGDYPGRSPPSDVAVRQRAESYARDAAKEQEDELNKPN